MCPARTKTKTKATAKAETPKSEPKAKPSVDDEGFPLTGKGERDKRYQFPPGKAPARSRGEAPGVTRRRSLDETLKGKSWEFVREGFDQAGVKSATGAALKRFYVIRNTDTGDEVIVGRGEMKKYAGITPPIKPRASKADGKAFEPEAGTDGNADDAVEEPAAEEAVTESGDGDGAADDFVDED